MGLIGDIEQIPENVYLTIDEWLQGYLPGGIPRSMETLGATVVKTWVANGALFGRLSDGRIAVVRKDGTIKVYRPYKPLVFGKKTDGKKFIRLAKRYRKEYKELHKIFGKSQRRSCK